MTLLRYCAFPFFDICFPFEASSIELEFDEIQNNCISKHLIQMIFVKCIIEHLRIDRGAIFPFSIENKCFGLVQYINNYFDFFYSEAIQLDDSALIPFWVLTKSLVLYVQCISVYGCWFFYLIRLKRKSSILILPNYLLNAPKAPKALGNLKWSAQTE